MLRVEGIHAGYGNTRVLRDVSVEVGDGEMVALLGPNGSGKTTLMKTIVGVLRPTAGHVMLDDQRLDGRRPNRITSMGVAIVPENRRVFSFLTVKENLLLAAHARKDKRGVQEDLGFLYDIFPLLEERSSAKGNELSGGQQQMVALGRAVMQRPTVVLMDEPSIGLSPVMVQQLPRMIRGVQERTGAAVLLVEQDAGVALDLATRGYVLRAGSVVRAGTAEELADSKVLLETYLGPTVTRTDPPAAGS